MSQFEDYITAGIKVSYQLKDEDWEQRRFAVTRPNGMHIDIVDQTEPKAGFWDKYLDKR